MLEQLVRTAASQAVEVGNQDTRATLDSIRDVVHSMSKLPGQRELILLSPGFPSDSDEAVYYKSQLVDLAASSSVVISALDARGLYASGMTARPSGSGSISGQITGQVPQDHSAAMRENQDVMAELAEGTGGLFLHNNNDLEGGFNSLAAGPEYSYLLEISLKGIKRNGSYHELQVKVDREGLKVQARRGFFAPKSSGGKR
jgi:VWFA-related protein